MQGKKSKKPSQAPRPRPYYKKKREQRVKGDQYVFFLTHLLISTLIFFILAVILGLFNNQSETISDILSLRFLGFITLIFILNIFSGIMGRILAYQLLYLYYERIREKRIRGLWDLMKGMNALDIDFWITSFISSLVFAFGMLVILQEKIFGKFSIITAIFSYLFIKIMSFIIVKWISKTRL